MFAEAGIADNELPTLENPWTWSEFEEISKKLKDKFATPAIESEYLIALPALLNCFANIRTKCSSDFNLARNDSLAPASRFSFKYFSCPC